MSTKANYMYGKEANFNMKTSVREPYWDYMARRGAGGGTMITTGTTTVTNEVYPAREDVPADLWGKPVAKSKVQGPIGAAAMSEKSAIQSEHSSMADAVNHPPHYNKGIETTKYIKSWDMNWNQANVVKYVSRYNLKNKNDPKFYNIVIKIITKLNFFRLY